MLFGGRLRPECTEDPEESGGVAGRGLVTEGPPTRTRACPQDCRDCCDILSFKNIFMGCLAPFQAEPNPYPV